MAVSNIKGTTSSTFTLGQREKDNGVTWRTRQQGRVELLDRNGNGGWYEGGGFSGGTVSLANPVTGESANLSFQGGEGFNLTFESAPPTTPALMQSESGRVSFVSLREIIPAPCYSQTFSGSGTVDFTLVAVDRLHRIESIAIWHEGIPENFDFNLGTDDEDDVYLSASSLNKSEQNLTVYQPYMPFLGTSPAEMRIIGSITAENLSPFTVIVTLSPVNVLESQILA